jgi:hypothetical protein
MKLLGLGLLFVLILAESVSAYNPEPGKVTAAFGPYLYKTNYGNAYSGLKSPWKGDLGLIVNGDVDKRGSLEVTLFHMNKLFIRDQSGMTIAEEAQLLHVGMGYRYWISPYFSTALDLFSAYSLGEAKTIHNDFAPGPAPQTSAHNYTDYGLELSLQGDLWSSPLSSVIVDARYARSITSKSHEQADHYSLLIGFKYLVQSKEKPAPDLLRDN